MIPVELGKLDLSEIPETDRIYAIQNQLRSLATQINNSLMSLDASDITIGDGTTLQDLLSGK